MTSEGPCLPQVPFFTILPSTFQDGNDAQALPPSYHVQKSEGLENLLVKSAYQLHFIISRARHQKFQDIWLKKQQYVYLLTSVSLPLFICYLASSSLSNMYPEHVHSDLLLLFLTFSHPSKRLQRNGIKH